MREKREGKRVDECLAINCRLAQIATPACHDEHLLNMIQLSCVEPTLPEGKVEYSVQWNILEAFLATFDDCLQESPTHL